MTQQTRAIIKATIEADPSITAEHRLAMLAAMTEDNAAKTTGAPSSIVRFKVAAERLGVCKMTVRALVKRGELVAMRLGNRVIGTTAESLENFIARGTMAQA